MMKSKFFNQYLTINSKHINIKFIILILLVISICSFSFVLYKLYKAKYKLREGSDNLQANYTEETAKSNAKNNYSTIANITDSSNSDN